MINYIILIFIGFVLLIKGADWLVDGSEKIAKRLHIPEIIIGLTIVSIGTSMPELIVSVVSSINGHADMAIGNVIGSNLSNILLILGLTAIIRPIALKKETKYIEIPIAVASTILLFILGNTSDHVLTRLDGLILVTGFVAFIAFTIYMTVKYCKENKISNTNNLNSEEAIPKHLILKSLALIFVGIIGLKIGGDLVVNNASEIAKMLNISEKIISITIVSIGTSLPELITSIMAAIHNDDDIAIGNIIGSSIFNILLILGVSSLISPISYSIEYNKDMVIAIIAVLLLNIYPFTGKKDSMTRINGTISLALYLTYIIGLFI